MIAGKPILELSGVSKRYGLLQVADAVSLSVMEGEAVGIIGPNGAGKTTLFNLIAGTVLPDAGRIMFRGAEIGQMPARARCRDGISRSFQIPHPFLGMTVFENALVGASFGASDAGRTAEERAVMALETTGLLGKANADASTLTLLERKRLELARSLATHPKLLLLDEIAGGLTEPECRSLIDTIADVRAQGTTIVWIEHVIHALLAVVDRIVVLDFGRLIADGEPMEIMSSPEVAGIYLGIDEDVVGEAAHV
jgi:branched-chain amino acid transport system ATP-binding protein